MAGEQDFDKPSRMPVRPVREGYHLREFRCHFAWAALPEPLKGQTVFLQLNENVFGRGEKEPYWVCLRRRVQFVFPQSRDDLRRHRFSPEEVRWRTISRKTLSEIDEVALEEEFGQTDEVLQGVVRITFQICQLLADSLSRRSRAKL